MRGSLLNFTKLQHLTDLIPIFSLSQFELTDQVKACDLNFSCYKLLVQPLGKKEVIRFESEKCACCCRKDNLRL